MKKQAKPTRQQRLESKRVTKYNQAFKRFARECDRFRRMANANGEGTPVSSIVLRLEGKFVGISVRHARKIKT